MKGTLAMSVIVSCNSSTDIKCYQCKQWLSITAFSPSRAKTRAPWCRQCVSDYSKATHNPKKRRDENLRRNYGITSEEYEKMFAEQKGLCASCKLPETRPEPRSKVGAIRNLCVDHDHETGQVRSLLCAECNAALGMLKDDPKYIHMLLEYRENVKPRETSEKVI
jgi:Recombination endonuclease VII